MRDIEKIKKIQKLSMELKRHGFANDTAEALAQSEEVYDEKIPEAEPVQVKEEQQAEPAVENDLMERISTRIDKLESQMSQVIGKINEIVAEFRKQKSLQEAKSGAIAESSQQRLPKEESSQRSGYYTSEDVAIDKVFYFGKK